MKRTDETDSLLALVVEGDKNAVNQLLDRYRAKLRRMVDIYMDPRVAGRADASDVVQEALAEAAVKLPEFAKQGNFPFYPWLRQLARQRLIDLHRHHIGAAKRSVKREEAGGEIASDQSVFQLAEWVAARESSPSQREIREERRQELMISLQTLPEHYRQIVVLRHLEDLQFDEIAAILSLGVEAVRSRYRRAIERLHEILKLKNVELS
ncbi:MAG: sigma-70 family RNA polymerase sigma factor [Planctomycetaceae bacterium]|nr:sigma-70 family RNA polymerase sigma factor [Planctomycetaceae bacterium]